MKNLKTIGLGILGGLLPISALIIYLNFNSKSNFFEKEDFKIPTKQVVYNAMESEAPSFVKASEASLNSVVHIKTKMIQQKIVRDPLMEFFYGPGVGRRQNFMASASGSGVIISPDGYIVTNNHVVQNASKIEVVFDNKESYNARVVGTDPSTDIAVLKIDAEGLTALPFGNSDAVKVGQWVLAVGNPFNLTSTVTAGIVSAKGRNINIIGEHNPTQHFPIESFIQTDAAVNPGNSGGALVNINGELIGINTAIASKTGSYSGYSFAIPSNLVSKIVKDIIDYGAAQRGFLGVMIADVNQTIKEQNDLKSTKGVFIAKVLENSASDKAGIKDGEVILKIGAKTMTKASEVLEIVGRSRPGDTLVLTILNKDGKQEIKNVVLQNKKGGVDLLKSSENVASTTMGASFSTLTSQEKKQLGVASGIKIKELNPGKLKSLGLTEGTVITKVNNKPVNSSKEFQAEIAKKSGGILLEIVTPTGRIEYIGFGIR